MLLHVKQMQSFHVYTVPVDPLTLGQCQISIKSVLNQYILLLLKKNLREDLVPV